MKSYKCAFVKANGKVRNIHFVYLKDVPANYLYKSKILRETWTSNPNWYNYELPANKYRVLDLEKNEVRIVNLNTIIGSLEEVEVSDDLFN